MTSTPNSIIGARTATVLLLFALLEVGLYVLGGFGRWTVTEQSARYGWRMLPSQHGWSRDHTVPEIINARGFRDREWAPPVVAGADEQGAPRYAKDESLFRVALVGNSYTYGTSVPVEQTFARRLEDRLRADFAARGIEREPLVMNFAVQGYVYEQMAAIYEDEIAPFRPDLFIYPAHPHDIVPLGPSADDADYDFRRQVLRSATFDMLSTFVINKWIPRVPLSAEARGARKRQQQLDEALSNSPFSRQHQQYWGEVAYGRDATPERPAMPGLEDLAASVGADGGELVVLSLPRWRRCFEPQLLGTDVKWGPLAESKEHLHHIDGMPAFRAPMAALVAEITAKGEKFWQVPDMTEQTWIDADGVRHTGADVEHADDSLFFLHDVGHLTPKGHDLLAAELFTGLQAGGLLP